MAELIDVMDAFSLPLKIAWGVWLTWGVAQIYWYRQERAAVPGARPARPARPAAQPRVAAPVPRPVVTSAPPAPARVAEPVAERIPEPEVAPTPPAVAPVPAPGEWVTAEPHQTPPNPADGFDPSQAVIETFAGQVEDLDSLVASFNHGDAGPEASPTWRDA
jgi:hypothetical protein